MKRRVGTIGGLDPNPIYIRQLDDYLAQSRTGKGLRTGILTDGKHWLLRWPGAGRSRRQALRLHVAGHSRLAPAFRVAARRGPGLLGRHPAQPREHRKAPGAQQPAVRAGHRRAAGALRETATRPSSSGNSGSTCCGRRWARWPVRRSNWTLFVRHTYLSMVIGMVVQASFGIDIRQVTPPTCCMAAFWNATGLHRESDFFAWEVGGLPSIRRWPGASPNSTGGTLRRTSRRRYETVIPPEERRTLGEYYTPDWLMVRELVTAAEPGAGPGLRLRHRPRR